MQPLREWTDAGMSEHPENTFVSLVGLSFG